MMNKDALYLVEQVLSIPTMSFHEEGVATFVKWYSLALGLSVSEDKFGNILVRNGKKSSGITFTAHMDHPGFEVISSKGTSSEVALWGKVDPKVFSNSKVIVYTKSGTHRAKVGRQVSQKKYEGRPVFKMKTKFEVSKGDFGHFDLPSMRILNGRIYTRAADNLMSVAAILEMFTELMASKSKAKVTALFTRGEEAGFLGAFVAMDSKLISKKYPLIVLECSSASHAKVKIGSGPVIRVGDWQSSYDPTIDRWIHDIAEREHKKSNGKRLFQRELLPGGRCEACVYIAEGYKTSGIALPLGNYHNQGSRGPAAEYVSVSDYGNMVKLMLSLVTAKLPGDNYLKKQIAPIRKHYMGLRKKLKSSNQ